MSYKYSLEWLPVTNEEFLHMRSVASHYLFIEERDAAIFVVDDIVDAAKEDGGHYVWPNDNIQGAFESAFKDKLDYLGLTVS